MPTANQRTFRNKAKSGFDFWTENENLGQKKFWDENSFIADPSNRNRDEIKADADDNADDDDDDNDDDADASGHNDHDDHDDNEDDDDDDHD